MRDRDRDAQRTTASFRRGMTIGAIVGAIIAGSSLWARWRRGSRPEGAPADETVPPPPTTTGDAG